jgi:hypothetical protein
MDAKRPPLHHRPSGKRHKKDTEQGQDSMDGPVQCPNPACRKTFTALRYFLSHLSQQSPPLCRPFLLAELDKDPTLQLGLNAKLREHGGQQPFYTSHPNFDVAWDDISSVAAATDNIDDSSQLSDIHTEEFDSDASHLHDLNSQAIANHPCPSDRYNIPFTTTQLVETKLVKLLNDSYAPHYLFKDLMDWMKDARSRGYEFGAVRSQRKSHISYLRGWKISHGQRQSISPSRQAVSPL